MSFDSEHERVRKALQWLSEERLLKPEATLRALFEDACLRFDLTPVECDYLWQIIF